MFFKRFRLFNPSKISGPTAKQIEYLNALIQYNNKYRAKKRTLSDWIDNYYKGRFDITRAKYLIEKLKNENDQLRNKFHNEISEVKNKRRQTVLMASDINLYCFCPKAFEFSSNNCVNRNYYELNAGQWYHGYFRSDDGANVSNSKNTRYLLSTIKGIKTVVWSSGDNATPILNRDLMLAGIPDGIVTFADDSRSIVEIKTKSGQRPAAEPFLGDILQSAAYYELLKDQSGMTSKIIILYIYKSSEQRQSFLIDIQKYRSKFDKVISGMKNILQQATHGEKTTNSNKCMSCGFRTVCAKA